MVNMQMSKEEAAEYSGAMPSADNAPRYPYGLCLCLNDEALAKLGITTLPAVGTKMALNAVVIVTSVGSSQQQDGEAENRAELQITDMELTPEAAVRDAASRLYGG
jgi:hypothetical protein